MQRQFTLWKQVYTLVADTVLVGRAIQQNVNTFHSTRKQRRSEFMK